MAVLNKIRQRSVFLIVIIALALFSFVLADVIRNSGFSKNQSSVGVVNGNEISREDFARQVESVQRNAQGNVTTAQAVNRVWDNKLRETLLDEQLEELEIEVGQGQINNVLRQQFAGNQNFTNEAGMFDFGVMREYVANLKATSPEAYQQWLAVEESAAKQAKAGIYYNMVRAGVGATLLEGEQAYKMENDNIDLNFVKIPYESVGEVEVSKDEIKSYLKDHKGKYEVEASRDIRYVFFEEKASTSDDAETKAELEKLMKDREEYNEVSQANEKLDGFSKTSNNEEFVNEFSDLPYEERFKFKDELRGDNADKIFNLSEGQTFGPYKEGGFWKVTKVTGVKQMVDSVKANHILVAHKDSPVGSELDRTKEEAKKLADSILTQVKSNDSLFASLAKDYSADTTSKDNGGDLGWVDYRNTTSSPFIDYIFDANSGKYGVVDTEYGYHVVFIEEAKSPKKAVKMVNLGKEIEPSEKTTNDLFSTTTKFEIAAGKKDFDEVAKESGYEVRPVKGIKAMEEALRGIGNQRRIVQWSFEEETSTGDIRRFDLPNGYVVAQLTAKNKKGLMSVEEASPEVTPLIRKEKQAKMIKDKISGSTLSEIASNQNVSVENASSVNLGSPVLPGATSEPKVVGAAFFLEKGKMSKPIDGVKGVYVVEVTNRAEAAPLNSYRMVAARKTKERAAQATSRLVEALKSSAEIEDNRAAFY
ncbi:peptidylprolyl isomerase [Mesonia ostreae]|uniref:Periplasmic chaperone PpiD n=1 Tax=Mesonia ostreae TaxID=861110 RepID=A0ABU2KHI5_9FLAO|nr:peptidylprolyl isomerase [Mesonia ostreae]MDT0294171.1 peptidylprolyl isomerase [Mesonia ostreae]